MPDESPRLASEELLRADALRRGGQDDIEAALAIYTAHAADIDPSTPEGCPRAQWLVRLGRELDPSLEDLVRRASVGAADSDTREAAEVFLFQFPFHRGDLAGAEAHLRGLLLRHRGTGSLREVGVVNNLALVYQVGGREFEVLVLARRAKRLAEPRDHVPGFAIACSRAAWALERLGEWEGLAAQADAIELLLPRLDAWHHPPALRAIHGARRAICLAARDHEGARRHHASVCSASTGHWRSDEDPYDAAVLEARIALAEGRAADAAAAIGPASRAEPSGSASRLIATALLVRALAAAGDASGAAAAAEPLLGALRAGPAGDAGASVLLEAATGVGDALPDRAAEPYWEAASALLLRRIAEIHECVANIEELSGAADEDREILSRHRARFVADQRRALEAIAALHEASGGSRPPVLEQLAEGGQLRICAWCLTISTPDGLTLPVGHLVPGALRLAVTHGICDRCREVLPG